MNYSPRNSKWINRDRFVLSNGHACALLYSMLHLTGYPVSMDDLKSFRQVDSITPGHPENFVTPGVEVSTGPLGQGISNAVGLAMAEKHLAAVYNKEDCAIVDHYTWVICGDGCLQEGISSEASSLAGHLGLGKLIVLYDDNRITIDGSTDLAFTEDVIKRYQSYGWHTQVVADVMSLGALRHAIDKAKSVTDKPSLIKIFTKIGHGSSKEGSEKSHGAPLGAADLAAVKTKFGFDPAQSFVVPDDVAEHYSSLSAIGESKELAWDALIAEYTSKYPIEASEFQRRMKGELPEGWQEKLPIYTYPESKTVATRNRSEECINALASIMPELIGGSADLTHSNLTHLKCTGDFQAETPAGRYIRFGVREHAMAAICNGLAAHGGFKPFCATFLNFIGYALGSVRLSALSRFGVLYVMTHDSIGQGEDGPTHQPVEMLESLRAMPNMFVYRPADGNEVSGAYEQALLRPSTPAVLSLSRQAAPAVLGTSREKVQFGAYVIGTYGGDADAKPALILVATGTELHPTVQAAEYLAQDQLVVRVVSLPCWELFAATSIEYQSEILLEGVPVMSVEAAGVHGWRTYAHAPFGMTTYGVSGPGGKVMARFGFTKENIAERAKEVLAFYANHAVPSLVHYPRFPSIDPHAHGNHH